MHNAVRREDVGNSHAGSVDRDRVERHLDNFALDRRKDAFREVRRERRAGGNSSCRVRTCVGLA